MKRSSSNALVLLFLVLGVCNQASGQQQTAVNDYVGSYFTGHNFGSSLLRLEPGGKFSGESRDCTTLHSRSGTYLVAQGVLRFQILEYIAKSHGDYPGVNLLDPDERKKFFGDQDSGVIAKEFELVPVRWGSRLYLMFQEDLKDFTHAINFGLEPRANLISEPWYGGFYLREGDEKKKIKGTPALPGDLLPLLLRRPVRTIITSVAGEPNGSIVTINKGATSGLRLGTRLVPLNESASPWSIWEVVALERRSAKIRTGAATMVGQQLTTRSATGMPFQ